MLQCDGCGLRFLDSDGILTCPDCLVPLRWLGEDPEDGQPVGMASLKHPFAEIPEEEIEVAHTAGNSIELDMILSNLRAEGVVCAARIQRDSVDTYLWPDSQRLFGDGTGPSGEAQILVHRQDLERARTIIRALLEGRMEGFPEG